MNNIRVWILRLGSIAALAIGGFLLFDSYQDLSWGRRAIAEAGASAFSSGRIQNEIVAETAEKERSGTASEYTGLLLISTALIMDGLAALLKRIASRQSDNA